MSCGMLPAPLAGASVAWLLHGLLACSSQDLAIAFLFQEPKNSDMKELQKHNDIVIIVLQRA